jgi:hypothetical protein
MVLHINYVVYTITGASLRVPLTGQGRYAMTKQLAHLINDLSFRARLYREKERGCQEIEAF